eukprot:6200845-Pleurochrysis_carterae.AAC.1
MLLALREDGERGREKKSPQRGWARSAARARGATGAQQQLVVACSGCARVAPATAAAADRRRVWDEQGPSGLNHLSGGGRGHAHVLEQTAQFAQCRSVRTVRERALDSVHRSHGFVTR